MCPCKCFLGKCKANWSVLLFASLAFIKAAFIWHCTFNFIPPFLSQFLFHLTSFFFCVGSSLKGTWGFWSWQCVSGKKQRVKDKGRVTFIPFWEGFDDDDDVLQGFFVLFKDKLNTGVRKESSTVSVGCDIPICDSLISLTEFNKKEEIGERRLQALSVWKIKICWD